MAIGTEHFAKHGSESQQMFTHDKRDNLWELYTFTCKYMYIYVIMQHYAQYSLQSLFTTSA